MGISQQKINSLKFDTYQMFVPQPTQIQHRNGDNKYAGAKQIGNEFEKRTQFDAYQMIVPKPTQIQRRK